MYNDLESFKSSLGMEQMFLISHNINSGQYDHIVYVLDITEEDH